MNMNESDQGIFALAVLISAFNAMFLGTNGIMTVMAPETWYYFVPGMVDTGPFNRHFVRDFGIMQLVLGLAFGIGMLRPALRLSMWAPATFWLIAHAVGRLWEVASGRSLATAVVQDFTAVTLPALLGTVITTWAILRCRGGNLASD